MNHLKKNPRNKTSKLTYLLAFGVLVANPLGEGIAPVLEQKVFGVLHSLAVAEATLRLDPGDHVVAEQVNLQPVLGLVRRLLPRTPRTAVALHSHSV